MASQLKTLIDNLNGHYSKLTSAQADYLAMDPAKPAFSLEHHVA